MSNYIKIDHSRLDAASSKIMGYVEQYNSNLGGFNNQMTSLRKEWTGQDSDAFNSCFSQDSNSVEQIGKKISKELTERANYLKFVANKYRQAQANAVNRANTIPNC